ncbi:hypothetical protein B0T20DRAFT_409930 [Sordaria brevicollis]|uniref:Uncharacterized protein n=1 Tax=Sordaria brevicollis TaxID=83679 RepID=A0AAE0PGI9_SORBR|nr:hypothetical protein B0T20DRAFT_409930 [Sordaria brevicollis]
MERYPDVRIENIVYDSSHKHKHTTSLPTPLPSPTFGTEFEHHHRYSHSQSHRGHLAPPSPRDTNFSETFSSGSKHNDKMCIKDITIDASAGVVKESVEICRSDRMCAVPEIRKHYQTDSSRSEPRYGGFLPTHLPPTPRESKEPSPVGRRDPGYLHGTRVSEPSRSTRHHDEYSSNYKFSSSPPDSKRKSDTYTRPSVVLTQTLGIPREETTRRHSPHERDPSPRRGPVPYREHSKSERGYDVIVDDLANEDRRRRRAPRPSDTLSTTATTGIPTTSSRPPLSSNNPGRYGSSPTGPSGMDSSMRRRNSVSSRNDDAGRTPRPRTTSGGSRSRASSATGVRFADELESKRKQQNAEIASRTNKPNNDNQVEIKGILKKPTGAREETKERSKERKGKGAEVDMTVEELRRSVESLGLRQSSSTRDRDSNVSSSITSSLPDFDYDRLRTRFDRDNGGSTGRHGREQAIRDGDRYRYY